MTDRFRQAISKASLLPEQQQDAIAAMILEEIEDEARWDSAFVGSQDVLEELAAEAEEADRRGLTQELDPDSL